MSAFIGRLLRFKGMSDRISYDVAHNHAKM